MNYKNYLDSTLVVFCARGNSKGLKNILTAKQIEQLDIDLSLRPENLSVNDYVRIAEELI